MLSHFKIKDILVKKGFELTESGGCWINRLNGMVIYKGTYSPENTHKTNYTICNGADRKYVYSEVELENYLK
jgi:hypothetical protein